jgi:hypothetical protein
MRIIWTHIAGCISRQRIVAFLDVLGDRGFGWLGGVPDEGILPGEAGDRRIGKTLYSRSRLVLKQGRQRGNTLAIGPNKTFWGARNGKDIVG